MNKDSFLKWEDYFKNTVKHNYPKWPNEVMVKIIFGSYLKNKININSKFRVLDVGCGFGNNLLPFLDIGCQCFGTEVTEMVARQTQRILQVRGFDVDIRCGKNTGLPFEDNLFDLVLSINVIHYEKTEKDIRLALAEKAGDTIRIKTKIIRSSSLGIQGKKVELLVSICNTLGAQRYLSPLGSKSYIEGNDLLTGNGIELCYHNYTHPQYNQVYGNFIPYLSVIDLLFNEGDKSLSIIRSGREMQGFFHMQIQG